MHNAMALDGDTSRLAHFYDQWAEEYDADVGVGTSYGMPGMIIETLNRATNTDDRFRTLRDPATRILDAGCGTGAVGKQLHDAGWREIHGIDLSSEMVKVAAERGVYSSLQAGVDLTAQISEELMGSADVVTIGGVFTVGHVPPEALKNLATIVRRGGLLVISTREAYLDETNFADVEHRLVNDGILERVVHIQSAPYTMDSTGDYWAWAVRRP